MVVRVLLGADPILEAGHRDPVEAGVAIHPDVAEARFIRPLDDQIGQLRLANR